jgi:hypothetical protein
MIMIRTRAAAASWAPLARTVLVASLVGCSSSGNNAGPAAQEGGIDASTASDGSVTDTGAGKARRTVELTWRVVVGGPSRPYVGYDGGGAGAGGGVDAGSDEAGADASSATTDGAVADAPGAPTDAESDGSEPSGAADAGDGGAMPLEGLEVCVYQNASVPCVMTDSTGKFTIGGLPTMSDVAISLKKTGYRPTLLAIETGSTNMDGNAAGPYPIPRTGGPASSSPIAVDLSTKGSVVFIAIGPGGGGGVANLGGAVGTMVSLTPAGGDGPYFIDDHGALDPSATSVLAQSGVYFNLDAGTYQLAFDDPNHDCASLSIPFGFGFSTSLANAVKFPIVAGYQTGPIAVLCTPASVLVNTADAY